jgi:hypothetical protein
MPGAAMLMQGAVLVNLLNCYAKIKRSLHRSDLFKAGENVITRLEYVQLFQRKLGDHLERRQ